MINSKNLCAKFILNIFHKTDKINPIMQKLKKLLYLQFSFLAIFNIIFAKPTDPIKNIIINKYPYTPCINYYSKDLYNISQPYSSVSMHYNYSSFKL